MQAFPGMQVSMMQPEASPPASAIAAIMEQHGSHIMRHFKSWAPQIETVMVQVGNRLRPDQEDSLASSAVFQSLCRFDSDRPARSIHLDRCAISSDAERTVNAKRLEST
jgi:hypothetical protein